MMTIDHLRVDHRIAVLQDFTDATGTSMHAGETGVIRNMSWDQLRNEIHIDIEREATERVRLTFLLKAQSGPRNGHMREFFEMGEFVYVPGTEPVFRDPTKQEMIVPPKPRVESRDASWWNEVRNTKGPDRQEEAEKQLMAEIDNIGVAASIAEMYAQRMRAFQADGNEPRAVAAFKLAVQWMGTYASWATSGGEGAALSYERDRFHDALVKEFGYDPTRMDA